MNKTRIILFLFSAFAALYLFTSRRDKYNENSPRMLQSNGDVSLPSSSFIIGGILQVYFDIDSTDITMAIQCNNPGVYFAIGFGSTGMAGSDIWVFTISGGQIHASDRYGAGYFAPPTDTSNGGTDDLTLLGYELTSSSSLVKVKRALKTGDPNDYALSQGTVDLIYAVGSSGILAYHATRGYVQAPLINGQAGIMLEDVEKFDRVDLHGIFNIIAWGVLVDIAIIVARYLRGTKFTVLRFVITAQVIHSALMWLAFILSTIVTITLLTRKGMDAVVLTGERKHDFHVINGLVILGLSALAVAIGGFNFYLMKNYKGTVGAQTIFYLKRVHLGLGFLLYLLTKANIILGVIFHNQGDWKVPVYIYLGVLFILHVLFQFRYPSLLKVPAELTNMSVKTRVKNQKHADLLDAINSGASTEKIIQAFPKIKWVQLGNGIYDLTDWVHPGGNFIIEACIGREVGRYFYGNYSLEGTSRKPHKHSQLAFSQVQKFYIGEVNSRESVLVHKDSQKEGQAMNYHSWKVVSMKSLSDTVSQISFTSEHFNVKSFGSSLSFLGRHFKVSFNRKGSRARQYTTALALTETNTELRQDIYNYFKSLMDKSDDSFFENNVSYEDFTDNLSLFIKNYPFPKALSRDLHSIDLDGQGNDLVIEGPIGRGLELSANSTGTHTIICAGTGILPFIDFLNVFLFKTMYQLIKEKIGKGSAEKVNVYKMPLDNIMEGLEVKFFGAFANKKEIIGLDIIEKLAEISKKYKVNNFNAIMKGYGDENIVQTKEYFSADFFRKNLTLEEEKYYIVGPPKMNSQVSRDLAKLGVTGDKIILV